MSAIYKPYEKRSKDYQYQDAMRKVLEEGMRTPAQSGVDTITHMGIEMRFKVSNGFPLFTERDLNPNWKKVPPIWQQAIGEIIAFMHGARTVKEIESFGCHWWKYFLLPKKCAKRGLEDGDNGPGSYGAAFHDFPMPEGPCNQFAEIIKQMKELPDLKTHIISPWIPAYTYRGEGKNQKVVVCPCHGWLNFRILNGKLTLMMKQRSADLPIGVPQNTNQYFALLLMVAQVLKVEPYEFIHYLEDAHFYSDQEEAVWELISREPRPFPTLTMNPYVDDLFDFRCEDFAMTDYNPHPAMKIPRTV